MDVPHAARNRRRTGHGRLLPLGLSLCLGVVAPAAAEQTPRAEATVGGAAAAAVEVRIDDGLLTLRAEGAPLAEVLRAVGAAGAFRVVLRGTFAAPVRDSFTGQPVERAVRRLAGGHVLVILYGEAPAPGRGGRAIAEIRVIEQQGQASSAGEPAPAVVAAAVPGEEPADEAGGDPFVDREEFRRRATPDMAWPRTKDDIRL